MDPYGISKLDLKRRNRMQILKLLQRQGPTSRIDLSASLDLTRAAVTIITNEMIGQDVLYEKGEVSLVGQKASRGRKKVLIDINTNFKFAFGIAVDRRTVHIGLSNISGDTLEKRVYDIRSNETKEMILQQLFLNMREMMANNCLEEKRIMGVGVCLSERAIQFLELKTEKDTVDYSSLEIPFEKEFPFPVLFDSVINGIAMAEIDFSGKLLPDGNVVTVRFSDTIDAAMIMRNEIYRGANHHVLNLAHMTVDPNGKLCHCGNRGCLISEFSDESIYVEIVNTFSEEDTPRLYEQMNGNVNLLRVAEVYDYILLGDDKVTAIFDRCLKNFSVLLNNLIAITDPQKIILFGHPFDNERYMTQIREYVANALNPAAAELIEAGSLRQENFHLSGCVLAVRNFFINKGGFDHDSN